jgi:hypothetical protein
MSSLPETVVVSEEHTAHMRLIHSTYLATDAQGVLLSLIQDKIEFLGFRIQGLKASNAPGVSHLEGRISELTSARQELLQFLKKAQKNGKKVKIKCDIHLELED